MRVGKNRRFLFELTKNTHTYTYNRATIAKKQQQQQQQR